VNATGGAQEPIGRAPRGFGRRTLARRLLVAFVAALVAVLAVVAVPLDRRLEADLVDDLTSSLTDQARAVRRALPADDEGLQAATVALARELGERITVVRMDGVVLADSEHDPTTIENHAGRPEIIQARMGAVGVASRNSETVGRPFRYVALPPEQGRIVRLAISLDRVIDRLQRARRLIAVAAALALAVGLVTAWLIARTLTRPLADVNEAAARIAQGDLATRAPVTGSAEVSALAATINNMASELAARIEEAQADRQTRDLVLSALDEGVVLMDEPDGVRYANPAAIRLLGRMAGDVPLAPSGTAADPFIPPLLRRLIGRTFQVGSVQEQELEIGRPPRTVLATAFPAGGEGLVLLVLRDVTEARKVDAIRRDFVAAASHELKTPVASIQAAAETLSHALDEDPEAARRFVANLHRDSERLSRIVMDLLDLSRLESERPMLEPVRLDVLAREELDRVAQLTRDAGLNVQVSTDPVTVRGSRKDLALVFSNLLDNAVRYTREGGTIRVQVAGQNGDARVEVSDTGIGIPTRELPRIFERFYRVDRARSRETGGTGLGLSIVKHVAEQHGGRVEARSELGKGSTFIVTLPP
jgi:two-component system, OmpR family, phosphate regulon sensor histidine kinase PhoR